MPMRGSPSGRAEVHVVKSAARTLAILEFFDEVRQPANVVTVSEALRYPQSSTAALLRSMVAMGYLQFDARARTYLPTDRVGLLGSWISPPLFEDGALLRMMRAIHRRTGQLALIAARNGDFAQYIHVMKQPDAVSCHIHIGMKCPIAFSGAGLVLLATTSDGEVKSLVHRLNAYASSDAVRIHLPELLAELAQIRRRGFCVSRSRVVDNFGSIAIMLPAELTSRPLVVGLGGCANVIEARESELVAIVREEIACHLVRPRGEGASLSSSSAGRLQTSAA